VFTKADGTRVGLDFYADNRDLALDHADHVATGAGLEVVEVRRLGSYEVFEAGSFYPVPRA